MPTPKKVDPAETRAAVLDIADWIRDEDCGQRPSRIQLADATRLTARTLAQSAPGQSVELRVPPFVAVQCIQGPRHTRGTPPNVVEMSPREWLRVATGIASFAAAEKDCSGTRAGEIEHWLPIVNLG